MNLPRGLLFYIDSYRKKKNFKKFLLLNQKAHAFDIWYAASSVKLLSRLFKLQPWGQKWPHPRGHLFLTWAQCAYGELLWLVAIQFHCLSLQSQFL